MKRDRFQAKDISDISMLTAVRVASEKSYAQGGGCRWAFWSDVRDALHAFPEKVVLAKLRSLVRRKLITGCACGCRGDFELTGGGMAMLEMGPYARTAS